MGFYGLALALIYISVTFGSLGIRNAAVKWIVDPVSRESIFSLLAPAFLILILTTIVTFSILLITYESYLSEMEVILTLLACLLYLSLYIGQGIYLGLKEIKSFNLIELAPKLTLFFLVSLLALCGCLNRLSLLVSIVCSFFFPMLLLFELKKYQPKFNFDFKLLKNLMLTGLPFCIALGFIVLNFNLPVLLSSYYVSEERAGLIFTAIKINDSLLEISAATALVIFAYSNGSNDKKDFRIFMKSIIFVTLITVIIVVLFFLLIDELKAQFYNHSYYEAIQYLKLIIVGLPFVSANKMSFGLLSGLGRVKASCNIYFLTVIVNLVGYYLLFSQNVENAELLSLLLSQIFACLLFFIVLFRRKEFLRD